MIEQLVTYSLAVWFAFYLINYGTPLAAAITRLSIGLREWITHPLHCALCFTFWVTLAGLAAHRVPRSFVVTAPVVVTFIDLAYRRLTCRPTTYIP